MLIRNKRDLLARGLAATGLLAVLERVARRPSVIVLCYHRISEAGKNPYYHPIDSATPAEFEIQMRFLRDRFALPAPELWPRILLEDRAVDRPTALITFDDGYRDNYVRAFPILQRLGISATFFLTTDFLRGDRLPWWDRVAYVLKQTERDRLTLEKPERLTVQLEPSTQPASASHSREANRFQAMMSVIAAFLRADRPDNEEALADLEARAGVSVPPAEHSRALFMSIDEVRALQRAGMGIGSHTRSHPNLARLPEHDQAIEILDSKAILENALGQEVAWLAYPYGSEDAFSTRTQQLVSQARYRGAFSLIRGVSRGRQTEPFAIPRIPVSATESSTLFRARADLYTAFGRSML